MEMGSIERELHIEATLEVVYEVLTSPEHLTEWWPDEAELEPVPGATGVITFGDGSSPTAHVVPITVLEADPPRTFTFRWAHPDGEVASPSNSFLVTFELIPSGSGTLLRMTETGFRDRGWELAVLEEHYRDHVEGWDHHLPRLVAYVDELVATP